MKTSLVANRTLSGQKDLKKASKTLDKNLQKLSTGKRINKAADDAAGLSIASKLNSKLQSSRRALRNTNDAISFVQVAESSLQSIHDALSRLRELSVQSASDTLSDPQRAMLNKEYRELKGEIQRITLSTRLFEKRLLDGKIPKMEIQVGIHKGGANKLTIDTKLYSSTIKALGIYDIDSTSKQRALKSMPKIDYALEEISSARAYFGSVQAALKSASANLSHSIGGQAETKSRVVDADYAKQTANAVKNKVIQNAAVSVQSQAKERSRSSLHLLKKQGGT